MSLAYAHSAAFTYQDGKRVSLCPFCSTEKEVVVHEGGIDDCPNVNKLAKAIHMDNGWVRKIEYEDGTTIVPGGQWEGPSLSDMIEALGVILKRSMAMSNVTPPVYPAGLSYEEKCNLVMRWNEEMDEIRSCRKVQ